MELLYSSKWFQYVGWFIWSMKKYPMSRFRKLNRTRVPNLHIHCRPLHKAKRYATSFCRGMKHHCFLAFKRKCRHWHPTGCISPTERPSRCRCTTHRQWPYTTAMITPSTFSRTRQRHFQQHWVALNSFNCWREYSWSTDSCALIALRILK